MTESEIGEVRRQLALSEALRFACGRDYVNEDYVLMYAEKFERFLRGEKRQTHMGPKRATSTKAARRKK